MEWFQMARLQTHPNFSEQPTEGYVMTSSTTLKPSVHANRFAGILRDYTTDQVLALRPTIQNDCALARHGAERLWADMHSLPFVAALGAMNGSQATNYVKGGLRAIYLSGWQVAADANLAG
jgi:isocitrate lyase